MVTLKEFMDCIDYSVTEGWQHQWDCFGPNAFCLDHHDPDRTKNSLTIMFDQKTQLVYCVEAHDYENSRSYRIIHPDFTKAFKEESARRGVPDKAYDDVDYVELEEAEDFLEKARAIYLGEPYDTRVSVPIDFTDEEMLKFMLEAHKRDMTFNQFVEEALREAIEAYKRDPEGAKQRAQEFINRAGD